ncbi:hypothetical protein TspCOW1_32850 [Thiohalobacter sp. COW1]|uniref:Uncharacterized protein n=1 Tax=Thiohalobacter thiocyanaticus TaxID=585455 RepID=A0A1Z4VTD1_9GAMM|nr:MULTISPECIES: hypothetical protein [Thiohalobacter]BAZ94896.1 uncharacterized protein FOKN1_2525 [Thiohalobacter thiocyanaticus]BCO33182.1 hypothetical protein TspCOW1_32850 [Thiohalobacter sp. COW1]
MKSITNLFLFFVVWLPIIATASDDYKITGKSGIMHFVAVDATQKDNEDVYRLAVGNACAGKAICQVQFWVGSAPSKFPLTDAQVESKLVQWQQNLNTGLRRWLVKCSSSNLFSKERECM